MKLELTPDIIDELIRENLYEHYTLLKDNFIHKKGLPMYSYDNEQNMELEFNLINSLRIVHNYYADTKDRILWK